MQKDVITLNYQRCIIEECVRGDMIMVFKILTCVIKREKNSEP